MPDSVSLRRGVLVCGLSVAAAVSMGVFVPPPAVAKPGSGASARSHDKSTPVTAAKLHKDPPTAETPTYRPKPAVWPSRASAVVNLGMVGAGSRAGIASVGGLPVSVTVGASGDVLSAKGLADAAAGRNIPTAVRLEVVDRATADKAGAAVAVRLSAADGFGQGFAAHVEIGYGAFAEAFGGNWSHRLGMVTMPSCAASTPAVDVCRVATRVPANNDFTTQVVSADVDVPAAGTTVSSSDHETSAPSGVPAMPAPKAAPGVQPLATPIPSPSGEPLPSASPAPSQAVAPIVPSPVGSPSPTAAPADPGSGPVAGDGLVVALSAAPSSQGGDFSKTDLAQSASWQAGGSSGDFSWSYPIGVPSTPGGLAPPVTLGYSSGSVDGRTANNNVQPSWLGEGFDYSPGFIERRYRPCALDTTVTPVWADSADQCWRMANASLSWNGHATELIPDDASNPPNTAIPTVWHLADDDGTKVEYLADPGSNVTLNWHDEHWRLTTKDGTQYWFGLSYVPGTATRTNSVQGMPVLSNHSGEPCFDASSILSSWCPMAYRWNLDYVVDPHGNSMVYTYAKETNYAHRPGTASSVQAYDRANYLDKIEYGWQAGKEATMAAPARVKFTTVNRCWELNANCVANHDASHWPDVPWDLDRTAAGTGDGPTFWGTKWLRYVDTQVWNGTTYRPVDSYELSATVVSTGHTGYGGVLRLEWIARHGVDTDTGISGPNVDLAVVDFGYGDSMQNRAAFVGTVEEAWKFRLRHITSESGGQINIDYKAADAGCLDGNNPPDPDHNQKPCFPQPYPAGVWTWWHKYLVDSVTEHDQTGASPVDIPHTYSYDLSKTVESKLIGTGGSTDAVLWRHDTDAFSSDLSGRSWNLWAGYPLVTEVTGALGGTRSKTMKVFWTGTDGDRTDAGDGTRSVDLVDTEADGSDHRDYYYRAGRVRETIAFDGDSATVLAKTLTDSTGKQTGVRSILPAWGASYIPKAWIPVDTVQNAYTKILPAGTFRHTYTDWDYDDFGNQITADAQGDVAVTGVNGDDTCTTTTYLTNPLANLRRYNGSTATTLATSPSIVDTNWSGINLTVGGGDFIGADGKKDLITRTAAGKIYAMAGTGTGTFAAGVQITTLGFGSFTSLAVADFTGDAKPDIVGNLPDNRLLLYPGNGTGGIGSAVQIGGTGWAPYDLFTPGDITGDGKPDLVGRSFSDGKLYVWPGDGTGSITTAQQIGGGGWEVFTDVFGGGDYTGDGKPDILAADRHGVWVYPGSAAPSGALGARSALITGVVGPDSDAYVAMGDITGDAKPDLLARQSRYLAALPSKVSTVGQKCGDPLVYPRDAVAYSQFFYDQPGVASPNLTATPLLGDLTRTEKATANPTGAAPTWISAGETTAIDTFGRPTQVKDPLGNLTTTAYFETNGLTTRIEVTNVRGHLTRTDLAVGRGLPVTVTDPNLKTTTGEYDKLGRLLKVWKPGHSGTTVDAQYTYEVNGTAYPPRVISKVLAPDGVSQITSYEILDGLLRPRQTQTPVAGTGRTITDTQYDSRGLTVKTAAFFNASNPSSTLVTAADSAVDSQHRYTYDGLGRQLTDELWSLNVKQWNVTTTAYNGDRSSVDVSAGGTDTTTLVDAFGRTTELWQYTGSTPAGNHSLTKYGYDDAGNLKSVAGPDDAVWTYSYDLLGRKTTTVDPDAGTSSTSYDNAGNVTSTTDSRGQVLSYSYDNLNRKTAEYKTTTKTTANQLAEWTYDDGATNGLGQLVSSTRYIGGKGQVGSAAYTRTVTGYNDLYQPTHTDLSIPTVEGSALEGTYGTDYTYNTNGAPATQKATIKTGGPNAGAVGGLPTETLTFTYNSIGQPTGLSSASQTYLASAAYSFDGQIAEQILGTSPTQVRHTYTYEPATRRPILSTVETGTTGAWTNKASDTTTYDQAGNIQHIDGTTNGAVDQIECFTYDYLRRLTAAWSEGSAPCDIGPGLSGGVDPYRRSWTFDDTAPVNGVVKTAGLRKTETAYNTDGTTAYQSTYTYGGTGKPLHSLASVVTTGSGAGTKTYGYDTAGNTTSRPGPGGAQQTLTWDSEGHLAKVSDSADTTFVYDADGARLIRTDPGGYKTLTLTDGTELRANGTAPVIGTRYYADVATRAANVDGGGNYTPSTLNWNITDHHGTGTIAINPTTLQADRRRSLPHGTPRGTQAPGFGNKGFVGGTTDPTGLTHLGAREYDSTTGRFTSIDPLFDIADPQSWNGYAYANNAPITSSDPSGTMGKTVIDDKKCDFTCEQKRHEYYEGRETNVGSTRVSKFFNTGETAIDDVVLPGGAPDITKLAQAVERQKGLRDRADAWCDYECDIDTTAMILAACDTDSALCSNDFMASILEQHAQAVCETAACDNDGGGFGAADAGAALGLGLAGARGKRIGPDLHYEPNAKHRQKRPDIGAEPSDPQVVLNGSYNVPGKLGQNEGHRVGYDAQTGDIVVFRSDRPGIYHGYVVKWSQLRAAEKNVLIQEKIFKASGKLTSYGKTLE